MMSHRLLTLLLCALLTGCTGGAQPSPGATAGDVPTANVDLAAASVITLSDSGVTVDGAAASTDPAAAVYTGGELVYYHADTDETYGEGTDSEKHTADQAAAHTLVTITQPGTYRLSGTLSQGQIAVDLGQAAVDDPNAVVTLVLDNANVTCSVAPALIFYNVYECDRDFVAYDKGENPDYKGTATVDTAKAGANVVLAAGSQNTFTGSHVARIYKEGTTDKLHKYDGAFYSKRSMNLFGDNGDNSGVLTVTGDHEGLDSELHLTINGGTVNVNAQNDGINTNEDGVSVTTVNAGVLTVNGGLGVEGDGIDSNGYLVINGGVVTALSNDSSPDGGIDADGDILLNGGTLAAFGTRNDAAAKGSAQTFLEFNLSAPLTKGSTMELKDADGNVLWSATAQGAHRSLTLSLPALRADGDYQLYVDGQRQENSAKGFGHGGFGGGRPGDGQRPDDLPEDFDPSQFKGQRPSDMPEPPEDFDPSRFEGQRPQRGPGFDQGGGGRHPDATSGATPQA